MWAKRLTANTLGFIIIKCYNAVLCRKASYPNFWCFKIARNMRFFAEKQVKAQRFVFYYLQLYNILCKKAIDK